MAVYFTAPLNTFTATARAKFSWLESRLLNYKPKQDNKTFYMMASLSALRRTMLQLIENIIVMTNSLIIFQPF